MSHLNQSVPGPYQLCEQRKPNPPSSQGEDFAGANLRVYICVSSLNIMAKVKLTAPPLVAEAGTKQKGWKGETCHAAVWNPIPGTPPAVWLTCWVTGVLHKCELGH